MKTAEDFRQISFNVFVSKHIVLVARAERVIEKAADLGEFGAVFEVPEDRDTTDMLRKYLHWKGFTTSTPMFTLDKVNAIEITW